MFKLNLLSRCNRVMPKWLSRTVLLLAVALILVFAYRWVLPLYRVGVRSQLVMLGDFNSDRRWDQSDRELMQLLLANPFQYSAKDCLKADLNSDGRLDAEDAAILEQLVTSGDPYEAEAKAIDSGKPFPRPRELYRYVSPQDYVNRPLYALPYAGAKQSPLDCLSHPKPLATNSPYAQQLAEEIYNELQAAGISVLFDDRDERAGVKFNDADLIGCPVRVTVGERGLQNGTVEVKARTAGESQSVLVSDIVSAIKQI